MQMPLLITTRDACAMLGIKNTTLYQLIKEGRLDTIKLGRKRLVKVASAHRLIDELTTVGRS